MILLTNPGERMMDPDFGVGLQEFLHEQNTASLVGRISARIQSQVEEYMSFIEVQETYVGPDVNSLNPSDNVLAISIKYSIIPISEDDVLSITLSDFGLRQYYKLRMSVKGYTVYKNIKETNFQEEISESDILKAMTMHEIINELSGDSDE